MKMQSFIPVRLSRMLDLARKAKRALKVQLQTCSICNGEQIAGLFQELYRNGNSEEFLNRG